MKRIGEIVQEQSLTAHEDLGNIARVPAKRTLTPSAGSGTADMTALTTLASPDPELAKDIACKLSTIRLWLIKPDDLRAVNNVLPLLFQATIPVQGSEASTALTRLLAHFPAKEATRDAIILSDLLADLIEARASLVAIISVCDEIRKEGSKDDPWLPPSGDILRRCKNRTMYYRSIHKNFNPPKGYE